MPSVLGISDILVRIRIRICGSIPLTNGSGFRSGSDPAIFVSDLQDGNKKIFFFTKFFCLLGYVLLPDPEPDPYLALTDPGGPKTDPKDLNPQHWLPLGKSRKREGQDMTKSRRETRQ